MPSTPHGCFSITSSYRFNQVWVGQVLIIDQMFNEVLTKKVHIVEQETLRLLLKCVLKQATVLTRAEPMDSVKEASLPPHVVENARPAQPSLERSLWHKTRVFRIAIGVLFMAVGAAFLGVVGAVQPFLKVVFVLVGLLELAVGAYNTYAGFKMSPQAGLIT